MKDLVNRLMKVSEAPQASLKMLHDLREAEDSLARQMILKKYWGDDAYELAREFVRSYLTASIALRTLAESVADAQDVPMTAKFSAWNLTTGVTRTDEWSGFNNFADLMLNIYPELQSEFATELVINSTDVGGKHMVEA